MAVIPNGSGPGVAPEAAAVIGGKDSAGAVVSHQHRAGGAAMSAMPLLNNQSLSPGAAAKGWVAHPVLDDLERRLRAELTALNTAMRSTVLQAVKVGAVLIEAKKVIGHGGWLNWVERTVKLKR
jgi:hypothetical protein